MKENLCVCMCVWSLLGAKAVKAGRRGHEWVHGGPIPVQGARLRRSLTGHTGPRMGARGSYSGFFKAG